MRIAHFGTFDVENYGDLLFPLVLERRLAGRGHELVHVSPLGGPPVWGDCVASIPTRVADSLELDGAIIGGGHLIHAQPSDVEAYRESADGGLFAYADLWLGSTLRAGALGIPIVWNAPGVPGAATSETAALLRWAAGEAAYLAVRDETSRGFLERAGCAGEIAVVIDTAIEVSRLWSPAELDAAWQEAFRSRDCAIPERAFAVHFNARFLADGVAETASRLDAIARATHALPILLALGPCHGDGTLAREIAGAMSGPRCLVDAPRSLREIAACIRGSALYVGSSLHGGVTARAFDRPALVVAREAEGGHAKFSRFLALHGQLIDAKGGSESTLVASWAEAWARIESLLSNGEPAGAAAPPPADDRLRAALDRHWQCLIEALEARSAEGGPAHPVDRSGFEALRASRWEREAAYVGVLLDQARDAAKYREAAQKNAQRFRQLERNHRDLKAALQAERARARDGDAKPDGGARS